VKFGLQVFGLHRDILQQHIIMLCYHVLWNSYLWCTNWEPVRNKLIGILLTAMDANGECERVSSTA